MTSTNVKFQINSKFTDVLKDAYSDSSTVFKELYQNGLRAGATAITVTLEEPNAVSVYNDGSTIKDFQKLLTAADSGWSEEVKESQNPFGVGFLSVVYAAEPGSLIKIESGSNYIEFTAEQLFSEQSISVQKMAINITGTCVYFTAKTIPKNLEYLSRGFSIPVFLDGKQCFFEDKLDDSFIHIPELGHIRVNESILEFTVSRSNCTIYLQGFKINRDTYGTPDYIIHLDHNLFKPRMPDRACLLNEDEQLSAINQLVLEYARTLLIEFAKDNPLGMANGGYMAARGMGLISLFDDNPYIPCRFIKQLNSLPDADYDRKDECYDYPDSVLTLEYLTGHGFLFLSEIYQEDHHLHIVAAKYLDLYLVDRSWCSEDHWLNKTDDSLKGRDIEEVLQIRINDTVIPACDMDTSTVMDKYFRNHYLDLKSGIHSVYVATKPLNMCLIFDEFTEAIDVWIVDPAYGAYFLLDYETTVCWEEMNYAANFCEDEWTNRNEYISEDMGAISTLVSNLTRNHRELVLDHMKRFEFESFDMGGESYTVTFTDEGVVVDESI